MAVDYKDKSCKCSRRAFLNETEQAFLKKIPDVLQIVSPLALDVEIEPSQGVSSTPLTSPSFFETRKYTIRAACKLTGKAHVYFLGLATALDDVEMTQEGAENLSALLNDQRIVKSLTCYVDRLCDVPFSYARISDHVADDAYLRIEGVAVHCHCRQPFSRDCWLTVYSIAETVSHVCRDVRKAKNASVLI